MNRFVAQRSSHDGRTSTTPPLPAPAPNDIAPGREFARTLKISKSSGHTRIASTVPAATYASNQYEIPSNQYQQGEYDQDGNGYQQGTRFDKETLDETIVGSDFDQTKSDVGFDPQLDHARYYDDEDDGDFQEDEYAHVERPERRPVEHPGTNGAHIIHYKQSRSPLINAKPEPHSQRQQPSAAAGRFEGKQHQDLQLRNGHTEVDTYRDQASRKRSRSRDVARVPVPRGLGHVMPGEEEEADEFDYAGGQPDVTVRLFENHASSDDVDHPTPVQSPARKAQRKSRMAGSSQTIDDQNNRNNTVNQNNAEGGEVVVDYRLIPDYEDKELKQMKYSDLEKEGWDMIPKSEPYKLPPHLQSRKATLTEKIKHHLPADLAQERDDFYAGLSTEEWEQAGDLFIEKFAELMKKLKEKKKEKRQLASRFEDEIKSREKAVRDQTGKIDDLLDGMAVTGQSLIKPKKV